LEARNSQLRMQRNQMPPEARLNLSEEQKEKITTLRSTHRKDMQYNQSILKEKEAHLKTLLSSPEWDENATNTTIDEISSLRGDLMKMQIANKQEMKSILSPEQLEKMARLGKANERGRRTFRGHGMKQGQRAYMNRGPQREFKGRKGRNFRR